MSKLIFTESGKSIVQLAAEHAEMESHNSAIYDMQVYIEELQIEVYLLKREKEREKRRRWKMRRGSK